MSSTLSPTVAAAPSAVQSATQLLATMAALSGQATDYNQGGQLRTLAESAGSITEQEGIGAQVLALQALAYGAMSLFGIGQQVATPATGVYTFATALPVSAAPPVPQAIAIPSGTIVATAGGIQFLTTSSNTLPSGASSITVGIIAATPGAAGNVQASGISGAPLTPVGWPLVGANPLATAGGANAGTQSLSLSQVAAKTASLGLSSPVAVANAPVGVTVTGTGETVAYAACYEPWLWAGSGAGSGTAGFTLFVDNGTGGASAALLAAVSAWIQGSVTQNQAGFRPAGVPYVVSGVTPVYASVTVSGALTPGFLSSGAVQTAVTSSVTAYFGALGISAPSGTSYASGSVINAAYQPSIAAVAGDAGLGAFQSLTVNLYYSGSSTAVPLVSGGIGTRVILSGLNVNITAGS